MKRDQICSLIREGLYFDNLCKLINLCDENFDENPVLYWTMSNIFKSLAEDYDNQAIPGDLYNKVMENLQRPLLLCFELANGSPGDILSCLNRLILNFKQIYSN